MRQLLFLLLCGVFSTLCAQVPDEWGSGFVQNQGQLLNDEDSSASFIKFYGGGDIMYYLHTDKISYVAAERVDSSSQCNTYRMDMLFLENTSASSNPVGSISTGTTYHAAMAREDHPHGIWNIPAYKKVKYNQLYEGVDLVCQLGEELAYSFALSKGVDPSIIMMQCVGATGISLVGGDVEIKNPLHTSILPAPQAYQVINNEKVFLDIEYTILEDDIITFAIGDYDIEYGINLIIFQGDLAPIAIPFYGNTMENYWTTFLKGDQNTITGDISRTDIMDVFYFHDVGGNFLDDAIYVGGASSFYNFPGQSGTVFTNIGYGSFPPQTNAFVARFDMNRKMTHYFSIGGRYDEVVTALTVDPNTGDVYATGITVSDPSPLPQTITFYTNSQAAPNMNFFTGFVSGPNNTLSADQHMFLLKLGNDLTISNPNYYYSTIICDVTGGNNTSESNTSEYPTCMTFKGSDLYIGGFSQLLDTNVPYTLLQSWNFSSLPSYYQSYYDVDHSVNNLSESFLIKIGNTGRTLQWITSLGGIDNGGRDAVLDIKSFNNQLYIYGVTNASTGAVVGSPCVAPPVSGEFPLVDPNLNANTEYIKGRKGNNDAFVIKMNSSDQIVWSTLLGGSAEELKNDGVWIGSSAGNTPYILYPHRVGGIELDDDGNIYIAGSSFSNGSTSLNSLTGFPIVAKNGYYNEITNKGNGDGFLTKFTPALNVDWSTFYGSSAKDRFSGLSINHTNNLLAVGTIDDIIGTNTNNFPLKNLTGGYNKAAANTPSEAFMFKMDINNGYRSYSSFLGNTLDAIDFATDVVISPDNQNIFVVGGSTNFGGASGSPKFPLRDLPGNTDFYYESYFVDAISNYDETNGFIANFYNYCQACQRVATSEIGQTAGELFEVYPNPTTHLLNIKKHTEEKIIKCHLFDALGRSTPLPLEEITVGGDSVYDVSRLPKGLYVLYIQGEAHTETIKIVIE